MAVFSIKFNEVTERGSVTVDYFIKCAKVCRERLSHGRLSHQTRKSLPRDISQKLSIFKIIKFSWKLAFYYIFMSESIETPR